MDAGKVKEIVFKALDDLSSSEWAEFYKSSINERLMVASAAEQESIKELPWCDINQQRIAPCERGALPLCRYLLDGYCAYPFDDPAADSEPDTEPERHWQERAEHFAGKLDDSLTEDEANSIRFMQIRDRVEEIDTAFSDTLKGYLERVEKVENGLSDLQGGYFNHFSKHEEHKHRVNELRTFKHDHLELHKKQEDDQLDAVQEGS